MKNQQATRRDYMNRNSMAPVQVSPSPVSGSASLMVGSVCPFFIYATSGNVPRFINLMTVTEIYRCGSTVRCIRHSGAFQDFEGVMTDIEDDIIGSYSSAEQAQDKMREFFDWLSNLESRVMIF